MNLRDALNALALRKPTIIMCSPEHYSADPRVHEAAHGGVANAFYSDDNPFNPDLAWAQWDGLNTDLSDNHGADIRLVDPVQGALDQVFTRDGGVAVVKVNLDQHDGSTITGIELVSIAAKFSNLPRNQEVGPHKRVLKTYHNEVLTAAQSLGLPATMRQDECPYFMEGGDFVHDPYRGVIWAGYSKHAGSDPTKGRTDFRSHEFVREKTGIPVNSIEVFGDNYHLDTTLTVFPDGTMAVNPAGLTQESLDLINEQGFSPYGLDRAEHLYLANAEDSETLAPNGAHTVGLRSAFPSVSGQFKDWMAERGHKASFHDLSQFAYGGGSAHCLTFRANVVYVDGGYAANPNFMQLMVHHE